MSIDFTCQKCEGGFELDAEDLVDGTEKLVCPHCGAKAPTNVADDFIAALAEMRVQLVNLSKRFGVSLTLDTEELDETARPGRAAASEEDDADEDEDEDDDEDDDDLDFDDDDEDDDDVGEDDDP